MMKFVFYDCSAESPKGRRSICYDKEGQEEREKKGVHPAGNAVDLAAAMGIELLNEDQYRELQKLGEFDTKTESWIQTPTDIRKLGGPSFAIVATAMSLCFITVRPPSMPPGGSEAR